MSAKYLFVLSDIISILLNCIFDDFIILLSYNSVLSRHVYKNGILYTC